MNYFICALTYVPKTRDFEHFQPIEYHFDGKEVYHGRQTNEATTKYLIDRLADSGKLFDKFLILVTDECVSIEVPVLGDITTFEYYSDLMKEYLRERIVKSAALQEEIEKNYNGEISYYLNSAFCKISVSDEMARDILKNINTDSGNELYLDFTGGSRISCLVSFLLMKVLEARNSEVKEIVYGDILSNPKRIVDCTYHYDLLKCIENLAKANGSSVKIMSELKRMKLVDKFNASKIRDLDDMESFFDNKLIPSEEDKKSTQEKIDEIIDSIEDTAKGFVLEKKRRITEKQSISGYTKLLSKRDRDLIKDFNESIIELLLDSKAICFTGKPDRFLSEKDIVLNLIKANDFYYCNYDKNDKGRGLVFTLKQWIKDLDSDTNKDPIKHYYQKADVAMYSWFEPPYPRKISLDKTKDFLKYLKNANEKIKIKETDPFECFRVISQLQLVYFNMGFPFMCTGVGGDDRIYLEISEHYTTDVKEFMRSLSALKKANCEEYRDKLKQLLKDGAIERAIPYWIPKQRLSVGSMFTSNEEKEEFVKTLYSRLEKVRPYRNVIAHNLHNEYSDPAKQSGIAEEIRTWLTGYREKFEK